MTEAILGQLNAINTERERRMMVPGLNARVVGLKQYQQRRFAHTCAGLLLATRYAAAVRSFLDELYGPSSFTQRDARFARVVPALVRLCPREIVETLAELHALSESLDTTMAKHLGEIPVKAIDYIQAWQPTGRASERHQHQIALTLA